MNPLRLLPLFCLASAPALAQTPDTTAAWRYFPLEIGNVWEYEGLGLVSHTTDHRVTVETDTVIAGQLYFVLAHDGLACSPCIERYLVRFDAGMGRMVERTADDREVVWWYAGCALDAPFGAETDCGVVEGGYEEAFELADGSVLEGIAYKAFISGYDLYGYIADVGFVTEAVLQMEPGERRLRYARVGGVEYGTPFSVSAEGPAAPESAVALVVYPNPMRGAATAAFVLDRPQRVRLDAFDVLGRRVLAEDLGALLAGEHAHRLDAAALPSGLYLVRLIGDAGTVATAQAVRP